MLVERGDGSEVIAAARSMGVGKTGYAIAPLPSAYLLELEVGQKIKMAGGEIRRVKGGFELWVVGGEPR